MITEEFQSKTSFWVTVLNGIKRLKSKQFLKNIFFNITNTSVPDISTIKLYYHLIAVIMPCIIIIIFLFFVPKI